VLWASATRIAQWAALNTVKCSWRSSDSNRGARGALPEIRRYSSSTRGASPRGWWQLDGVVLRFDSKR
jgi:hypothetical protein